MSFLKPLTVAPGMKRANEARVERGLAPNAALPALREKIKGSITLALAAQKTSLKKRRFYCYDFNCFIHKR